MKSTTFTQAPTTISATINELVSRLMAHWGGASGSQHTVVAGGFGSGKSFVLERAVELARRGLLSAGSTNELSLAMIRVGATATSSYDDLLYEVARALAGTTERAAVDEAAALRAVGARASLERLVLSASAERPLVLVLDDVDLAFQEFSDADLEALGTLMKRATRRHVLFLGSTGGRAVTPILWNELLLKPLEDNEIVDYVNLSIPVGVKPVASLTDLLTAGHEDIERMDAATLGNPRFWRIVASHLDGDRTQAVTRALQVWFELLSTYFRERLASLAPSERRIVVELARAGQPTTVGQLAEYVGVSNPSAASSLGRLNGVWVRRVEPAAGADRRSTWYELSDPLLRSFLRRRQQTSAATFVASAARAWERVAVPFGAPPFASATVDERIQMAEALGLAAQEAAARDTLRQIFIDSVIENGLTDPSTIRAMAEWGRWMGESGARKEAVAVLSKAAHDARQIFGEKSAETLHVLAHLAWNQLQSEQREDAARTLGTIQEQSVKLGPEGLFFGLGARQNEAIVVGEAGNPAGAVAIFEDVLEQRKRLTPDDLRWQRACKSGLAWWMAKAGRTRDAIALTDALIEEEPPENHGELLWYRMNRLAFESNAVGEEARSPEYLISEYLRLADDARAVSSDSRAERDARRIAFEIASDVLSPSGWPVAHVHPRDFVDRVGGRVLSGQLASEELGVVLARASEAQIAQLAVDVVFGSIGLSAEQRALLARTIGSNADSEYGPLLIGLADALEGKGAALSALPAEWTEFVAAQQPSR